MFKILVFLALIACVLSVPTPSENIESIAKNPVEPASSSLDGESDDLERSEFIWKFWPWYYPSKVVYAAPPVQYKVVYPAPVIYKVEYPEPVVYKTVVQPPPVIKAVPATPVKQVSVAVTTGTSDE